MSNMKRILSLLLAITIVTAIFIPFGVSAAEAPASIESSDVEDDLAHYYKDLNIEFPKNPKDDDIYLAHFIESGFDEINGVKSTNYGLYVYIYNPSGKQLINELNKIQFAIKWAKGSNGELNAVDYKKYELSFVNANDDHTLIKYKVAYPDRKLVFYNETKGTRRYDISGIEFANRYYDIEEYTVGYTYTFSGYAKGLAAESYDKSTLSCRKDSVFTIKVKAHQVSYITGSNEFNTGYANQINSVYFSIPKEIEEKYGGLYTIKYEYNHYYTSPIIVTDNSTAYETLLNDRGKMVNYDTWTYEIADWNTTSVPPVFSYDYVFHYGKRTDGGLFNPRWYEDSPEPNIFPRYLTTVFNNTNGWDTGDLLFTAEELETYFKTYNLSYHTGVKLGYSADLFDLSKSTGYQVMTKNINDQFSLREYNDQQNMFEYWADCIFGANENDYKIDKIRYITPIASSSVFKDEAFEKNYLVDDLYKEDFESFYKSATANGENVYLLRYAYANDYQTLDLESSGIDGNFIMCQGNVYLNFDFIYFGFGDSEDLTIIPCVSDPTSGYFDGIDTTPENKTWDMLKELLEKLEAIARVIGIVLLVVGVIALVALAFIFIKPLNDWLIAIFSKEKKKKAKPPKTSAQQKRSYKRKSNYRKRHKK